MFSTYEECSNKIKELLNEKATNNIPYVYEGIAHYGGYWNPDYTHPYLEELKTKDYKYDDFRGFDISAYINLRINNLDVQNSVRISFEERNGKYTISVSISLDNKVIADKNKLQMALFACDINNSGYLKDWRYSPSALFVYDYTNNHAYIDAIKEFVSISEEDIYMFLSSALCYRKIEFIYGWLGDIDNEDYYMLDEDFEIDDVLRDNIEIQKSIETIQYDL